MILLSAAYLAPVPYYALLSSRSVTIERECNYERQTYRNRCHIASANGVLPLSIPVEKPQGKALTCEVVISEHTNWQMLHWRAIEAAYNSSPFFEYYRDDLFPFYQKKWKYLFDFDMEIQQKVLELLDIESHIQFSTEYQPALPDDVNDLREQIHPKKAFQSSFVKEVPYYQVFKEKNGFIPQLSIIDLLFNEGPESVFVLQKMVGK